MHISTTIKLLVFSSFLSLNVAISFAQCTAVSESDSTELVNLYNATDGDNWNNNDGWLLEPVSEWYGVTLTDDGCFVKEIYLAMNNLQNSLIDLNMESIESLHLGNNILNGEIPNLNLPSLKQLSLSGNQLSGQMAIVNCPNLETLNLSYNSLEGSLLYFNSTNLYMIDLQHNNFTGSIPNFNLSNLEVLNLSNNNLSGVLPDFSSTNLEQIYCRNNLLTGSIPNFNLPNLKTIDLSNNQLSGVIPDFENLNLTRLYLRENQLTGEIHNFDFYYMYHLDLSNNQLSGEIPNFGFNNVGNTINLSNNQLSGEIPNFENIAGIEDTLDLSNNQLSGEIPNFDFYQIHIINLYNNQLSGEIPNFEITTIEQLHLSNNNLSGQVPNFNLPNLISLELCPNYYLEGFIPPLENCPLLNIYDVDISCLDFATTNGYIYSDEGSLNENCWIEDDDWNLPNVLVHSNNYSRISFTDENGFYQLDTDSGNLEIGAIPSISLWEQICPEDEYYIIEGAEYGEFYEDYDFGFIPTEECPVLALSMGTHSLVAGSLNSFTVECCNLGTTSSGEESYIHVQFPEMIIPLSSSFTYEDDGNGNLQFEIGSLGIGECIDFTITDSISVEALAGYGVCVEATVYPNELCLSEFDLFWDQSNLLVNGVCENDSIYFTLFNQGEDMQSGSQFRIYEDDLIMAIEIIQLESGEEEIFAIEDQGFTYKGVAIQTPYNPFYEFTQAIVEDCATQENLGIYTTLSEGDDYLSFESDCQYIVNINEPQAQTTSPSGIGENNFIDANTQLTYKISFQNTTNDTVSTVIITDTLDIEHLDISSLKMAGSSHDYYVAVEDSNILKWAFYNIDLVDSTTNSLDSKGFVQFKINQRSSNQNGDIITNKGAITLDYDEPIQLDNITHTVYSPDIDKDGINDDIDNCILIYNTAQEDSDNDGIGDICDNCPNVPNDNQADEDDNGIGDACEEGINSFNIKSSNLIIHPNPFDHKIFIQNKNLSIEKVTISNINGKVVLTKNESVHGYLTLNTTNLKPGIYYLTVQHTQGSIIKKIIKM